MISIENLSYSYKPGEEAYLKDIDLHIREGEYIALVGANGCGKTTLTRHFNALLLPSHGEVIIDGLNSREVRHHAEIRRKVGMVFQNPENQIVGMSVEEDVAFGPGNLRLPSAEIRRRVGMALELVGLDGYEKRLPHTLSGGEKQLLALAGLLAMNPSYIVLDEATSSLDPCGRDKVLSILTRLIAENIAVVHVTHNMDEALQAKRVLLMCDGRVISDGPSHQVLGNSDLLKSMGLAPPLLVELTLRLQEAGYKARKPVVTIDEAVEEIKAWLSTSHLAKDEYEVRGASGYA